MIEDMQLRGYSARTQEAYARAVRQLAEYVRRSPAEVTEEELRQYFLYLANEKKFARATTTIALCGIRLCTWQNAAMKRSVVMDVEAVPIQVFQRELPQTPRFLF